MAVLTAPSRHGRSYQPPHAVPTSRPSPDPMSIIQLALASSQGHQLIELLAAQLKGNQFIGQPQTMAHDFDLSHGSREVMYVTFRMGPRRELVFKIGPETIMRHAVDRCLETWRSDEGRRFMAWELFFYLPDNVRIDYYKPMTAAELGVENHDLIDVFSESHGG
ncbi:hypothetical protein VE03_00585 [Pseudogymnoascus sp. 23342-1-I1]|nr:hypothetical protein VE03_00585 [Pseudogymnoascus sp. 23342-1-I1]